jgi:hypothetical protein
LACRPLRHASRTVPAPPLSWGRFLVPVGGYTEVPETCPVDVQAAILAALRKRRNTIWPAASIKRSFRTTLRRPPMRARRSRRWRLLSTASRRPWSAASNLDGLVNGRCGRTCPFTRSRHLGELPRDWASKSSNLIKVEYCFCWRSNAAVIYNANLISI